MPTRTRVPLAIDPPNGCLIVLIAFDTSRWVASTNPLSQASSRYPASVADADVPNRNHMPAQAPGESRMTSTYTATSPNPVVGPLQRYVPGPERATVRRVSTVQCAPFALSSLGIHWPGDRSPSWIARCHPAGMDVPVAGRDAGWLPGRVDRAGVEPPSPANRTIPRYIPAATSSATTARTVTTARAVRPRRRGGAADADRYGCAGETGRCGGGGAVCTVA